MIEVYWGEPLTLVVSESGEERKISTIEQAKYWLKKRWPVIDDAHSRAISCIEGAMECMLPVEKARHAFMHAAKSAGFKAF